MATTYVQRSDTSDLSGGGEYSRQLVAGTATISDLLIALAASQTKTGHSFTAAGVPGTAGITGNYTVEVDIAIGDSNVMVSVAVGRVNSAGTIQTESSFTAEQAAAGVVLTFNLTSVNLGTWAAGDRLRVAVRYRNSHTHSARDVTVSFNTDESEVIAPWTIAASQNLAGALFTKAPTFSTGVVGRGAVNLAGSLFTKAPTFGTGGVGYSLFGSAIGYFARPAGTALVSTPDHASLDITGDIDIRALIDPTVGWLSGTNFTIYAKRDSAAITNLAYQFQTFRLPGNTHLRLIWKDSGGTERSLDSSANTHALTGANWVRAVLDVDNGSSQASASFYTSQDPITTDPGSVSWTQLGTTVNGAFGTTSIASGAAISELGSYDDGTTQTMAGKFYYAEVRDGIAGTIVTNPDFRDRDQLTSDSTLTDSTGKVWTVNSPAVWHLPYFDGPTFSQGAITATYALTGTLFTKAPTFSVGDIATEGGIQNLSGVLFERAPSFSQGTVASTYNLAGQLFTKAPTFNTGAVTATRNIDGVLYQNTPTFFQGAVTPGAVDLSGTLFQKAPTFPLGSLLAQQPLTGTLFTKAPTFFAGSVAATYNLAGVLFQKAPTFSVGAVTSVRDLAGVLFTKAPTFFAGAVTVGAVNLSGVLFQKAPSFFAAVVGQEGGPQLLGGTLFQKAPTFPQGSVTTGAVGLTGVLFQKAPTFAQGAVASTFTLSGVLFQKSPTFPVGALAQDQFLSGVLFAKAPTFSQGSVSSGVVGLAGVLFQKAPTFTQGAVVSTYTLVGALFQKAPTFPQGEFIQEQFVVGVLFENTPQFFQGAMGTGVLDGVPFVSTPTFFVGVLTQGERVFPTWPASSGNGWETGEGVDWPVSTNPEWEVVS